MITAIIVDNEEIATFSLKIFLEKTEKVVVKACFNSSKATLNFIKENYYKENKIDVVFLDIALPEINGLTLCERIQELDSDINIIFVTAYNEYAVDAFSINAIDYLLKPVAYERIQNTVERVLKITNTRKLVKETSCKIESNKDFKIKCFGNFEICNDNNESINFRTRKAEELAAYFIQSVGNFISKGKIIADIWTDVQYDKAEMYFHTNLYHVRKFFLKIGKENKIEHEKGRYKLIINNLIDFVEFENFEKDNIELNDDNINDFERLFSVYKKGYLSNNGYMWSLYKSEDIHNKFEKITLKAVDYCIFKENCGTALKYLNKVIEINPYNEEANDMIMKIYHNKGDIASLVKQFEIFKNVLIELEGITAKKSINKLKEKYKL